MPSNATSLAYQIVNSDEVSESHIDLALNVLYDNGLTVAQVIEKYSELYDRLSEKNDDQVN